MKEKIINTIRALSIDAIQKANSGHPGLPMGAAPMAFTLWSEHMKMTATAPQWIDRDRFVLSAGHGSMLQYALLHLFGYDVSMEDIKNFRQWGSKTPGHPEYGITDGVDATTGPLGQGFAMAVGMAMAEAKMAADFNKDDIELINHYTFAISGDGCMQEGITSEAASLAGHLKLGKLIVLYDDNGITIDGSTDLTFTEDIIKRFQAYDWQTIVVDDGNDIAKISAAIAEAKANLLQPTLIKIKTTIGYGSPNKAGTSGVHGAPLGVDELKLCKENYGLDAEKHFNIDEDVKAAMKEIIAEHEQVYTDWQDKWQEYSQKYSDDAEKLEQYLLDSDYTEELLKEEYWQGLDKDNATRNAGGIFLNAIKKAVPNLIGGSADLNGSTKTYLKEYGDFSPENRAGDNIFFGIREHAMAAICNGISLHGGYKPYCATFMSFADYMKPSIRLSALMKQPVLYIFTHDSIGVGEDGPTHQPVEQLLMLRSIPNLKLYRPASPKETAYALISALKHTDGPSVLVLSRQTLRQLDGVNQDALRGGYVISAAKKEKADGILIASGSEVAVLVDAQAKLAEEGIDTSVVSMLSKEEFYQQDKAYIESVLPKDIKKRLVMEAGVSLGWHKEATDEGAIIAIDHFGESSPAGRIFEEFGFTVENAVNKFKEL